MMVYFFWPLLYAETHFRLPFLFNRLFKKEPEIIADVPFRLLPGQPLPVLILVKDADRFPIQLLTIDLYIDAQRIAQKSLDETVTLAFKEWLLEFDVPEFTQGWHNIQVKITYRVQKRLKTCFADNYQGTSHRPFRCFFASEALPSKAGFYAGDLHSHSSFTSDQIEFGASLKAMQRMASAIGLDFFGVTDHSYDLDDAPDNYLKQDPSFPKWQQFQQEVKMLNNQNNLPLIIPGEEVSVRNAKQQTVHLLVFNNPHLIVGSGDSGERWLHNKSEFSIREVLQQINQRSLAMPAHPAQPVPLAQRIFINRGPWAKEDLIEHRFAGFQLVNGGCSMTVKKAVELWKALLLKGKKVLPVAGNDAHGHFNRVREIAIPFIKLQEHQNHIFGFWKTLVFCSTKPQSPDQLLTCLNQGRLVLTNGPFLEILALQGVKTAVMGQTVGALNQVVLEALANHETGFLKKITMLGGFRAQHKEKILWQKDFKKPIFRFQQKISLTFTLFPDYIRAELQTESGMALTNCIWIKTQ